MIPDKIKILGHEYPVIFQDVNETGNDNMGTHDGLKTKIFLRSDLSESQKESTLLHEILEAIDYNLRLNLKHEQIFSLESGLYQVLKDNKGVFNAS